MTVLEHKDSKGYYYQWGNQKKYYFIPVNRFSRINAYNKASRQGRAIEYSKHLIK